MMPGEVQEQVSRALGPEYPAPVAVAQLEQPEYHHPASLAEFEENCVACVATQGIQLLIAKLGLCDGGSPEPTAPAAIYLRASQFSDVEFIAHEHLEQFTQGQQLTGAVIELTHASCTHRCDKLIAHIYPASFYVKKLNERYVVIRLNTVDRDKQDLIEFEVAGLWGYKSKAPDDSEFYRCYGTSPNFRAWCSYKDRGVYLARIEQWHPILGAFNNYSMNRPVARIDLTATAVGVREQLVDAYLERIKSELSIEEIKLLLSKLHKALRE